MPLYEFNIGEQSLVGARFIADVRDEIQRALFSEKNSRKITQQQIAEKLGTSRAVINRQIMGLENMGLRRVAEILWAIGWRPQFKAEKIPASENYFQSSAQHIQEKQEKAAPVLVRKSSQIGSTVDPATQMLLDDLLRNQPKAAPVPLAATFQPGGLPQSN